MTAGAVYIEGASVPAVHSHRHHVRSPVDVLRLVIAIGMVGAGLLVANLFDTAFLGLRQDGEALMADLPAWAGDVPPIATRLDASFSCGALAIFNRLRIALPRRLALAVECH